MTKTKEITAQVINVIRKPTTSAGNPSWSIILDDGGVYHTWPNADVNWSISTDGMIGKWFRFEMETYRGSDRIVDYFVASGDHKGGSPSFPAPTNQTNSAPTDRTKVKKIVSDVLASEVQVYGQAAERLTEAITEALAHNGIVRYDEPVETKEGMN